MALFAAGRLDESSALAGEVAEMNRVLHSPSESALDRGITAAAAVIAGDPARAEAELALAFHQLSRARYPWASTMMAPIQACARALDGNLSGALAVLDDLVASPDNAAFKAELETLADRHRALVNYFVGDPVRFSNRRRQELIDELRSGPNDELGLYQACIALELASAEQDAELARSALPLVREALEGGWVFTTGWPFFLPRLVGNASLLLGDVDAAIERLGAALTTTPIDDLPLERGRVRFDLARALALSAREGDRADAIAHARHACQDLTRFPRCALLERAQKLVRFLESRT